MRSPALMRGLALLRSPALLAVRTGLRRGWREFGHIMLTPTEQFFSIVLALVVLTVLYFQRDNPVAGTDISLATMALPGVLAMLLVYNGVAGASFAVSFEREDGTLLRCKAAPYGLVGYVVGNTVRVPLNALIPVVLVLVPGLFLFQGLTQTGAGGWLRLVGFIVLGLLACVPVGLALGGAISNPRALGGYTFFVSGGLIAISGIFYPLSAMPGWLHPIAEIFPFYWLGLGMRSALLPDTAASAELFNSWRHLETVIALGGWAVVGLLLAPVLLRRMARQVSGASVEAGRLRAAQRVG